MKALFLVGLFGAAGAVSRFVLSAWMLRAFGERFPWGTFTVNIVGCGLIGVLFQWNESMPFTREWRSALTAGFLGGLTTFSAFGLETIRLVELGRPGAAVINVFANVCFGLIAVWLGMAVVRRLVGAD